MEDATASIDTPLGRYALAASEVGLVRAQPSDGAPVRPAPRASATAERMLERACSAIASYFAGRTSALATLPLDPQGSAFQRRVWSALREIPPGTTASYGEIAARIGRPGAARAVGNANRCNPIALAIPCHRVIGRDGRLVGYAGGLARKRWLLAHEAGCARPPYAASSKSNGPDSGRLQIAPARSRDSAAASI